jgi:hypothetical protein
MHWRNNIPLIKCEKKTKQHREDYKYKHKKQIGRYQQIGQELFLFGLSPTPPDPSGGNYLTKALKLVFIFIHMSQFFLQFE